VSHQADEDRVSAARRTLALLNRQVDEVRAELLRLRRELAQVRATLPATQPDQLMEANEKLVLAALDAKLIAESAVIDFDELARTSQHDALTGTPNRVLMLDRVTKAIALARRHRTRIAVFFLDLDNFKEINDTLGHAIGDEVLQQVARRLESVVRESDTVSRHGGDEFLVLLAEVRDESGAAAIAAKIGAALAEPCQAGGHALALSASLGIAIYPEDGEDPASLISHADAAMYRAKRSGRGDPEGQQNNGAGGP
jgi:diguanylate cyclase (GGDEF)-like protein